MIERPVRKTVVVQLKVATIECSTCSALLEVYPQDVPGEPSLGWDALNDGRLQSASDDTTPVRPR
jgi:hypothetical protein